ncbi:MAG: hypothetical protein JAY74_20320 [Candidatus Thiodiazotropha taylori]|nr:hypothetical protein [Candidatus Thiodiazotropha taylori]
METSEFSGFSSTAVQSGSRSHKSDHRAQPAPDMRNLIRQILSEELNSMSAGRLRSRSRSRSKDASRRERRIAHTFPDPDPMDSKGKDTQSLGLNSNVTSGAQTLPPAVAGIADDGAGSQLLVEPEIAISVGPDETIGSGEDSEGQDIEDVGSSDQVEAPSQLPYIEALGALRSRLGSDLCPEKAIPENKSGASALDFFDKKSKDPAYPSLPQSRLILDVVTKINSRIQGENPIPGSPLNSYPKGMGTNKFPTLNKPKVFAQDSYRLENPTLGLNPAPLDPSFREVLKQGASLPTAHSIQLQQLEGWERLARAGIHITSHADMFLYGILSALGSSTPSQSDLSEIRRYLQALAQSHLHIFDVLVRLASGPLLARRDAFLAKCALDPTLRSSLRVQPIESATLFGSKMPEVSKTFKEDLTRKSLQNAAVSHPFSQKQKKKPKPKTSSDANLVVSSQESGQRQVSAKPAAPSGSQSFSFSSRKQKKNKKPQNKK